MKRVLIDASSFILVHKCGILDIVIKMYHVNMSTSVVSEIMHKKSEEASTLCLFIDNGDITVLQDSLDDEGVSGVTLPKLGAGEKNSILHYTRIRLLHQSAFLILDDGKAARFCQKNSFRFINALLLVRILFLHHQVSRDEAQQAWQILTEKGRYSENILQNAATMEINELSFFYP